MIELPEFETQLRRSLHDGVAAVPEPAGLIDRMLSASRLPVARPAARLSIRNWLIPITAAATLTALALVILLVVPHHTGSVRPVGPISPPRPVPPMSSTSQSEGSSRPSATSSPTPPPSQSLPSRTGTGPAVPPQRVPNPVVTGGGPRGSGPLFVAISVSRTVDTNFDGRLDAGDQVVFAITLTNRGSQPIVAYNVSDTYREGDDTRYSCGRSSRPTVPASGSVTCVRTTPYLITAADTSSGSVRRWAYSYAEPGTDYYDSTTLTIRLR